jgi:hypothetical protein
MKLTGLILWLCLAFSHPVNAAPRIAVLNFELYDITSLPNTPDELTRTTSMKPLLEQAIKALGDYEIIQINLNQQNAATAGLGYLFNFNEVVAKLGKQYNANWVVVGRHSKPSFLYSYLMAHLIDVKTRTLAGTMPLNSRAITKKSRKEALTRLQKS